MLSNSFQAEKKAFVTSSTTLRTCFFPLFLGNFFARSGVLMAMECHNRSTSPLGYTSDGGSSVSSASGPPEVKQRTQTFRLLTRTPPNRCSTIGPESVFPSSPSPSNIDVMQGGEDENGEEAEKKYGRCDGDCSSSSSSSSSNNDNCCNNTSGSDEERSVEPNAATTLPSLAEVGAAPSSASIISSHDTSFRNSLVVSQEEQVTAGDERMPSMDPRRTLTHKRGGSGSFTVDQRTTPHTLHEVEGDRRDAKEVNTSNTTRTTTATPQAGPAAKLSIPRVGSEVGCPRKPSSSEESLSVHSYTAVGSRVRSHPASPAGDVRTLRDLLMWRSRLSDSQYFLDGSHEHDGEGTACTEDGHAKANPFSKSAPAPQERASEFHPSEQPALTPVTPELWTPMPVQQRNLHAPPLLPSLFDPASASALSVTAAPASHRGSRDDLADRRASPSGGTSPFSSRLQTSPPTPSQQPPHQQQQQLQQQQLQRRTTSNYLSKSELDDSFASSVTSHITSPVTALPPHHAISSPYDSRPRISTEHYCGAGVSPFSNVSSPILSTPMTARAAAVHDTRRASHDAGETSANANANSHQSANNSNRTNSSPYNSHADGRQNSMASSRAHPAVSPASSSSHSISSAWGIEDHAPPHPRSVGFHHLPVSSPIRHHLASRSSEASASPRNALACLHSPATSQDVLHSTSANFSPVCRGTGGAGGGDSSSQASQCGTVAHPHGATSSAMSTPSLPIAKATPRERTKLWRGLKAPEEYPAFATPVDDDTNKAVVAFVTGVLLLLLLGFIFAI